MFDADPRQHVGDRRVNAPTDAIDGGEERDLLVERRLDRRWLHRVEVVGLAPRRRQRLRRHVTRLISDAARRACRDLQAIERDFIGIRVPGALPGQHPHADALAQVARRLLDDPIFERRRLRHPVFEEQIGVVRLVFERRPEHAVESAVGDVESITEEVAGIDDVHSVASTIRGS